MILYGALFSPFVRKVAMVAEEKGLTYSFGKGSPMNPTEDFIAASPFRKMPAISDGDYCLSDSTAIVAYLDAKHPANPMLGADAETRGRVMWFDEFSDTIYGAAGLKIVFNQVVAPRVGIPVDEAMMAQGEADQPRALDYLEQVAPETGWLAGDFSLADISVACILKTMAYCGHGPDAGKYPRTAAWYGRVAARPAWVRLAVQEKAVAEQIGFPQPSCV